MCSFCSIWAAISIMCDCEILLIVTFRRTSQPALRKTISTDILSSACYFSGGLRSKTQLHFWVSQMCSLWYTQTHNSAETQENVPTEAMQSSTSSPSQLAAGLHGRHFTHTHTLDRSTHIKCPNIAHSNVILDSFFPAPFSPSIPPPPPIASIVYLCFAFYPQHSSPKKKKKKVSSGSNSEFVDIIWISKGCQALKSLAAEREGGGRRRGCGDHNKT